MKSQSAYEKVQQALDALSADKQMPCDLFKAYFSVRTVAEAAGVSPGTAKRHLDTLAAYREYERKQVHGQAAYRKVPDWLRLG